jgi:amino acid transporter
MRVVFTPPLRATIFVFAIAELILAIFSRDTNALFVLFGAATLWPAIIYARTVILYVVKRKSPPPNQRFTLGRREMSITVVSLVWLAFELLLFRDKSFAQAWLYVVIMIVIGALYLGYLPVTRGGATGLKMRDIHSIDAELDRDAAERGDNN